MRSGTYTCKTNEIASVWTLNKSYRINVEGDRFFIQVNGDYNPMVFEANKWDKVISTFFHKNLRRKLPEWM